MSYPVTLVVPSSPPVFYALLDGGGNYAANNGTTISSFSYILSLTYRIVPRASAAEVRSAQQRLNSMGAGLAVDGNLSPNTATAISNFQATRGLLMTGVLDAPTKSALLGASTTVNPADLFYPQTPTQAQDWQAQLRAQQEAAKKAKEKESSNTYIYAALALLLVVIFSNR